MAAIYRINYKSDFLLTLYCDAGWATPFCLKFWTGAPSKAYFAGYDGEHYTHCAPDAEDPLKLVVQFDDHHLPVGDLKFQVSYHFAVADFPHDTEDEVLNAANITTEMDGEQAQVMLDFNGETAPEIEFSLPAYSAEAQRIANEQARIAHEAIRIANEESRIAAETTRQQNETQRINNEAQRIRNEEARIAEFAQIKAGAIEATNDANSAADLANEKAQLAADKAALADEKAQLATDKASLAQSAATLATEKAQLATDKAALAQSAATLANDKAALAQQKAEYATAQGDYAKEQGDYAKSQADLIPADVMRTASDAAFVNANREALFYMRQADEHFAGLMTSAEHNKLAALPTAADLETGIIYDVSSLHPTSGVSGGSTYASLSAALAVIPQDKRKGGMTVKFVQSADNKYVQYFLTKNQWSASEADWEKINLEEEVSQLGQEVNGKQATWTKGFYINAGTLVRGSSANFKYSSPLFLKAGRAIHVLSGGSGASFVTKSNANGDFLQALLAGTSVAQLEYSYTLPEDGYYVFSYKFGDASSYMNVDGVPIENMLSDDSISERLESAELKIGEIEQDIDNLVGYTAQTKTDEEKEIARTNINAASKDDIPVYGKQNPIIGLDGATEQNLTLFNKIVKSFIIRNIASGFDKENVRFAQLYYNVQYSFWQIQLGYNNGSAVANLESFSISNPAIDTYQTSSFKIVVDWGELDNIQPSSTSAIFQNYAASNPYKVHFADDDKYFDGTGIKDESIGENKLSLDLQDKINSNPGILKGKKLVTLCDSLGAAGVWQAKLAELTGMVFDSTANKRYSIGGTKTLTPYMTCGQGRVLQLISDVNNQDVDTPDLIIVENVNDGGWNPGTITDESFTLSNVTILDNSHKQTSRANAISYWDENKSTILGSLTPRVGTILGIPYSTQTGVKLTITHAATADGNFGILLSDSGESVKNIAVSAGDSIETIVDKIMEYNFNAYVHEKVGTDSIVFTKSSGEAGTVTVYPNNTGITSTTTSGIEGTQAYYVYFLGHDVANWNNAANWVSEIPLYQAWKGMIEMLISAFPNAMVYWFIPKSYQFNYSASQYTRADGTPDWDAMLENDYQTYMFDNQIKMAEYMNIPVLDIRQDSCINPGNISVFCNNNNVHPKTAGYNRWGEVLAGMLT